MPLDRTIPPPFKTVSSILFPWPQELTIQPTIPLFVLHEEQLPLVSLTLLFDSGTWYEPEPGVSHLTMKMLLEGTKQKSAEQIATSLDHYGAYLSMASRADYCSIGLMCLAKYFTPMLDLVVALCLESICPLKRLEQLKYLTIQSLKVENEKTHLLSHRYFKEALLGQAHPYGRSLQIADIKAVTQEQVINYHQTHLLNRCRALLSGAVTTSHIQQVQDRLANFPCQPIQRPMHPIHAKEPTKIHIPKTGSLQSAICIGKLLFSKTHPDYLPMYIVTMLLGGYFGSRLMRNIREEKGYTYHIYASLLPLREASYFFVSTESIQAYTQQTCQEIYREIEILQTEYIHETELSTLRNYLLGHFLSSINDPFSMMERFKDVYLHDLGQNFYQQFYDVLHHITPIQIKEIAHTYLSLDSLTEIIVG